MKKQYITPQTGIMCCRTESILEHSLNVYYDVDATGDAMSKGRGEMNIPEGSENTGWGELW